ncbi:hypothetical protein HDE_05888 [Halotydeus destructor]|nr:hypothetical protein HDE_05888 [Halotydeus destructor]
MTFLSMVKMMNQSPQSGSKQSADSGNRAHIDSHEVLIKRNIWHENQVNVLRVLLVIGYLLMTGLFGANIFAQAVLYLGADDGEPFDLAAVVIVYNTVGLFFTVFPFIIMYKKWLRVAYIGWTLQGQLTLVGLELIGVLSRVLPDSVVRRSSVSTFESGTANGSTKLKPSANDGLTAVPGYSSHVTTIGYGVIGFHLFLAVLLLTMYVISVEIERLRKAARAVKLENDKLQRLLHRRLKLPSATDVQLVGFRKVRTVSSTNVRNELLLKSSKAWI